MRKPRMAKIFFQTAKGKTKQHKRGFLTIPASIVRELEGDGWRNKDTVWIGVTETARGFMVFYNIEDFAKNIKRIRHFEDDVKNEKKLEKKFEEYIKWVAEGKKEKRKKEKRKRGKKRKK